MNNLHWCLGICLLLTFQPLTSQNFKPLDSLSNHLIESYNIKGISIVAVKNDSIVYKKAFGYANDRFKMNDSTPIYIASNTKAFIGLAMLKLINENKISLDDPITKFIDRKYFPNDIDVDPILIRDILGHTSGLSNDPLTFRTSSSGEYPVGLQELLKFTVYIGENDSLEQKFSYSNLGYLLCGIIIENVSGMHWKDYLEKEILTPLGLNHTQPYLPKAEALDRMAHPYIFNKSEALKVVKKDNTLHAAGGLFTNVDDMGNWLRFYTSDNEVIKNLRQSNFDAFEDTLTEAENSFGPISISGYGYGWYHGNILGLPINFHAGGFSGHNSFISYLPEEKLGIFIFVNENSNLRLGALQLSFLYYYLMTGNANLKKTFPIFEKRIKSVFESQKTNSLVKINASETKLPVGTYFNDKYGTLRIEQVNDEFQISLGPNLSSLAFKGSKENEIIVQFIPESDVHFEFEGSGDDLRIKYGEDFGYFVLKE